MKPRFPFLLLLTTSIAFAQERDPGVQTTQPGVTLTEIASHPDLATPTGVDVDAEGRVWVIACHTHFPPETYAGPKLDEILIFAPDGTRTVFYNQTYHTMDLELGPDGWVYLAERDRILRIKDSDGDGVADTEETLAALTTEADYPHNGLSGLAWNPQGELCFGLGENYAKAWTLKDNEGSTFEGLGEGGVFRIQPDGKALHRFARGMWNPFGLCVREDGEMFAVENDPGERPPCRLLHIVDGADYGYQRVYGPESHHPFVCWNGELRGTLPMVHPVGEGPCGVTPLGNGLIATSWSDNRVDFFSLRRAGVGFEADRIQLIKGERYFRPVGIAPAKALSTEEKEVWYLTDWVDGNYMVHGFGRLWRLEIDLKEADWVGPLELEAPNEATRLAASLRDGTAKLDLPALLSLVKGEDPYLARAALLDLARKTGSWNPETVATWSPEDRPWATIALKLAEADPEIWVRPLLQDASPEVQFEVLRWIADFDLKTFLPEVEEVLSRSDLDFTRFEAGIAAWNTLKGKPEAGVRDKDLLLARIEDPDSPPKLRAYALRLFPNRGRDRILPESDARNETRGLTVPLLRSLLEVGDETLSLEVVRTLAGNTQVGESLLADVAKSQDNSELLRAEAIAALAAGAERHVPLLLELSENGSQAVREEALRCLRLIAVPDEHLPKIEKVATMFPGSAPLVSSILDRGTLMQNRPPLQDTDAWFAALDAIDSPADPAAGERLFLNSRLSLCANCHRHGGRGQTVGPDLSVIGDRGDHRWLLESILDPNREIAPEYLPRMITLKDGTTFTGLRLRSSTTEVMQDATGTSHRFSRDDIASMQELQVSFMPPALVYSMTDRELRDLIAFLEAPPAR